MIEKYVIIPADINRSVFFVSFERNSDCAFNDTVHREIDCDCYEHVRIHANLSCSFLVDECGKLKDPAKPVNYRASVFYPGAAFGDPLVGDVFVCDIGLVDGESDFVPLSDEKEERLLKTIQDFEEFYFKRFQNVDHK